MTTPEPLDAAAFDALMAPLGPFEPAPRLAVGLSGGADSLALTLLLHDWLRARGGALTALTVDHGLRPESAAEARAVGRRARALGIAHRVLTWRGGTGRNLQAEARRGRYRLLLDWCEAAGVLHLALAHQRDDRAETLLLNLVRGSGLDGLAAMAPLSELGAARLLRPLLPVPRARLEALLRARGLDWVEDPGNRDPRFARIRVRRALPDLERALDQDAGVIGRRLADAAGHLARARAALEAEVAALLARSVRLDPAGWLLLDPTALAAASGEVGLRALARVLATVGGRDYPPRFEALEALHRRLAGTGGTGGFRGATLGGCRLAPRRGGVLVAREGRAIEVLEPGPGAALPAAGLWDGRFRYRLARGTGRGWRLAPLGREALSGVESGPGGPSIPAAAREALPAFFDAAGVIAVPQLGFFRDSAARRAIRGCRFAPRVALSGAGFTVA